MHNLSIIEEYYKKYTKNLSEWIPEGIFTVDLPLLASFDLLSFQHSYVADPSLTRYFHVIESSEKITLINEEFVIWIVTERLDNVPVTYTLIAINQDEYPHLEVAFAASGVYNSSLFVLRLLEKFLIDIQENERLLKKLFAS